MSQPIRKVPLTHGAQWLIRAINLGTRNPRAIFGAALLLIAVLYLVLYLFTMPLRLGADSALYADIHQNWSRRLEQAVDALPRFPWETVL